MKKQLFSNLSLAALAVTGGLMFASMSGCKDDTTPPVVTLNGDSEVDVMLGDSYDDEGATATDDKDGDVTASITSDFDDVVDFDMADEYTVTYTAMDDAMNSGTATRMVNVYIAAENLDGIWYVSYDACQDTAWQWSSTASVSGIDDTKLIFADFGGYTGLNVTATIDNKTMTIASQIIGDYTILGNGTIAKDGKSIDYSYSITYNPDSSSDSCSGTMELQ